MSGQGSDLLVLDDPAEVLRLLRAGDRLAHCHATGWRLVRADVRVDGCAVGVLRDGFFWLGADGERLDLGGGRLAPLDDGLPGIGQAQTWAWAEGRSNARH